MDMHVRACRSLLCNQEEANFKVCLYKENNSYMSLITFIKKTIKNRSNFEPRMRHMLLTGLHM